MKPSRSAAAIIIGAAALTGAAAPASTEAPLSSLSEDAPAPQYEEHQFSGSSTSAQAFQVWFDGGEFVQPTAETRDLRQLRVNDTQVAEAGDVIYKDENGDFWVQ